MTYSPTLLRATFLTTKHEKFIRKTLERAIRGIDRKTDGKIQRFHRL